LPGEKLGDKGRSEQGHGHPKDHTDGDFLLQEEGAPEDAEGRDDEGHGGGGGSLVTLEEAKEEDKGDGGAEEAEGEGAGEGAPTGQGRGREEQDEGKKDKGGGEEAPGGNRKWGEAGEPGPGVVAGEAVAGGGPEDGEDRPSSSVPPEVELIPGEDCDAAKAYGKAEGLEPGERDAKPPEPDEGGADGGGGIEQGGESSLKMEGCPAQEGEGEGGTEEPQDQEGALAIAEGAAVLRAQEEEGEEGQGGNADAGEGGGEGAEFRGGNAHEQEGGSPDGGEQQQPDGVGKTHLVLVAGLGKTGNRASLQ